MASLCSLRTQACKRRDLKAPGGVQLRFRAKAVANGAVLHYIDNTITSRVCDSNYGTTALIPFNPMLPEHRERIRMIRNDPDGLYIGPLFSCIARKVSSIVGELDSSVLNPLRILQLEQNRYFQRSFIVKSQQNKLRRISVQN